MNKSIRDPLLEERSLSIKKIVFGSIAIVISFLLDFALLLIHIFSQVIPYEFRYSLAFSSHNMYILFVVLSIIISLLFLVSGLIFLITGIINLKKINYALSAKASETESPSPDNF